MYITVETHQDEVLYYAGTILVPIDSPLFYRLFQHELSSDLYTFTTLSPLL